MSFLKAGNVKPKRIYSSPGNTYYNKAIKMSTNAIVSVSNLDINKVSFGDIRLNKAGGKSVPIKYNGQNLQIRIPKMTYPMGVNIRETENGSTYQMAATLKGCPHLVDARADADAGELGQFYNFLYDLQEKLLQMSVTQSVKWFSKARKEDVLRDSMKQFISPSVEKINGEWVPTGKYPPSLRMKVPVYDGRVTMDVASHDGKALEVDTENIVQVFPKRVEASIVVAPSVYVSNQSFGVTWRITFARVSPPQRLTAAQVFADEIEEESRAPVVVHQESAVLDVPTLDDEQTQEEVMIPLEETPTAPAPATAQKSRRRVAAAGAV